MTSPGLYERSWPGKRGRRKWRSAALLKRVGSRREALERCVLELINSTEFDEAITRKGAIVKRKQQTWVQRCVLNGDGAIKHRSGFCAKSRSSARRMRA